jgi:hypothetical protein
MLYSNTGNEFNQHDNILFDLLYIHAGSWMYIQTIEIMYL